MIVTICNTEMVQNSSDYSGKEDFYDKYEKWNTPNTLLRTQTIKAIRIDLN